jgi:hypothetical protein
MVVDQSQRLHRRVISTIDEIEIEMAMTDDLIKRETETMTVRIIQAVASGQSLIEMT